MENPLSGMELFIGGITGLVGFIASSMTDRALATRDSAVVKSASAPIYSDLYRLGAAASLAAFPLIGAHFIRSPLWRSGLQFFGVASLLYLGGKLFQDLGAKMLHDNTTGQRLFQGEIAAQDMLAAAEKKTGGAGLPQGTGAPNNLPPPPQFQGGPPSPAAMAAVRGHAPALRALGGIHPDLVAMNAGRATPEQIARVDGIKAQFKSSLAELGKFHPAELEAAVGLAGITTLAVAARPKPPPQQPAQQRPPPQPQIPDDTSPYGGIGSWANNS
jgi:hypothetical protein